jgi:tetratricopeptide (TPR) repeat protein
MSFAQGRAAFERQDFVTAFAAFEAAVAAGMTGPAVHYNIGVAAYRLHRYDRARQAFEEVARTPSMAALAHYNLGLIAQAQSDEPAARDHFTRAYVGTQDERLKDLARTQLDASAPVSTTAWAGFASAGAGYDDNVTLTSGGTAVGIAREEDAYADLLLAGSLQLRSRWRVDGDVTYLNYADLDAYDQVGLSAGGRYRLGFDAWRPDVGAQVGATFLDGDSFERRQTLFVQASRSLTSAWTFRPRYRLNFIDGAEEFSGLDGIRHDASARFLYSAVGWGGSTGYRFELSDYDSAALSATRHQVFADVYRSITDRWTLRGSFGYRHSEYDDTFGSEDRVEFSAGLDRSLDEQFTLVFQYFFTDSAADAPELDYSRNRLFVGVEAAF